MWYHHKLEGGTKDEYIQRTQERKEKSKRQEYGGWERKGEKQKKSSCISRKHIHKVGNHDTAVLTLVLAVRGFAVHGSKYVSVDASEPDIDVQLLDINPYSRPGSRAAGSRGS